MVKAFSEDEKLKIKNQIVKVAQELFRSRAIKDVKISEITAQVGIAKGSFYNFFSSKESLLLTIVAEFEEQIHQQIIELMITEHNKKELFIKVLLKVMEEISSNELFKALLDADTMLKLFKGVSEEQKMFMLRADETLLLKLVESNLKLKVPISIAIDLLRSIFYMQLIVEDIQSDMEIFNRHLIRAVVNEIFE